LAQGADSVVGILWKVADKPTAIFMRYFYQALKTTNGDNAESLRQAQLQLKRKGRYKHPRYWAGFVLTNTYLKTTHISL
jgi:CHAT domain-containing protein